MEWQIVVDVVGLEIDERLAVHGHRAFAAGVAEIGQLGGNIVGVPRVTLEGYAGGILREAAQVCRSRVEIVYTVFYGVVNQSIDHLLVYFLILSFGGMSHGPPHTAVSEQGYAVAVEIAVCHFTFWNLCCLAVVLVGSACRGHYGGGACGACYFDEVSS